MNTLAGWFTIAANLEGRQSESQGRLEGMHFHSQALDSHPLGPRTLPTIKEGRANTPSSFLRRKPRVSRSPVSG